MMLMGIVKTIIALGLAILIGQWMITVEGKIDAVCRASHAECPG